MLSGAQYSKPPSKYEWQPKDSKAGEAEDILSSVQARGQSIKNAEFRDSASSPQKAAKTLGFEPFEMMGKHRGGGFDREVN